MTSILIVEDDPLVAEALKLQLVGCGYHVAAMVSHGEEAVVQAQALAPGLVLMDIVLAGKMDGIEAAQKIRDCCDIPVLYLTAYADDEFFRRAKVTEPYAYLLKSSTSREIQLAIEIALYRHKAEQTARAALENLVTERTAELEQARGHLAKILERISDAFISLNTEWRYTYVNTKAGELFGCKPEMLIGKHIWTEFPVGVGQPFYHAYHKAIAEQVPVQLEAYYPTWERWFENRIYPSKDGICIFFHDTTERKRAEKALQASECNLRQAQSIAHIGSWDFDLATAKIAWSEELYRIYGVSPEAFTPSVETLVNLIHPDDQPAMQAWIAACASGQKPGKLEFRCVWPDGSIRYIEGQGELILDADGKPDHAAGTAQDITERKQVELKLQESEKSLKEAQAIACLGSYVTDLRTGFWKSSGVLDQLLGIDEIYERSAKGWSALIHPGDRTNIDGYLKSKILGKSETVDNEFRIIRHNDQSERWMHGMGKLEFDAQGSPLTMRGTIQDITERKKAELELITYREHLEKLVEARTADLEASNKELEAYSYSVSHDLRAPLRAMQGFAQALDEDFATKLGATGKEYVQRIVAGARRMDTLIQDLLDYSQLGRAEMQLKPASLAVATRDALSQIDSLIKQSAAQITVAPSLPEVMGHAATLTQIISNLLGNAIKFVTPGNRPVVKVWAEERGERVRLWVEDNGIGIAPEHQARIFRVFERLHGVETYPGTGIGLAIVRKGAERMGGEAGVESTVGKGSRFWVELDKPLRASTT